MHFLKTCILLAEFDINVWVGLLLTSDIGTVSFKLFGLMGIDYSVKLALFQGQTKSGHSLMLNIDQCKCQHACLALEERLLRTMGCG